MLVMWKIWASQEGLLEKTKKSKEDSTKEAKEDNSTLKSSFSGMIDELLSTFNVS